MGYVYFAKTKNGMYKIGMTTLTIEQRMKAQRYYWFPPVGNGVDLTGYIQVINPRAFEKMLHNALADYQYRGEVFELTDQQVQTILDSQTDILLATNITDTLLELGVLQKPPARKYSREVRVRCPQCNQSILKHEWKEHQNSNCTFDPWRAVHEYRKSIRDAYQGA